MIAVLCSGLPFCAEAADQSSAGLGSSGTTQHTIDEFIQCLPSDWETLLVSRRPERFGQPGYSAPEWLTSSARAPLEMAAYSEDVSNVFQGRRITVGVGAAREFRRATDLGASVFEGASLIVFEEEIPNLTEELSEQIAAGAINRFTIAGSDVLSLEAKIEKDLWKLYLFQPSGNTLIAATNQSFLSAVLGCIGGDTAPSALPTDLPQWRVLDRDATIWGMRRYRSRPSGEDVSSHLFFSDPYAIGLTVMIWEDGDTDTGRIIYFSESPTALQTVQAFWNRTLARKTTPTFSQTPEGSVQIDLRDEDLNMNCGITLGEILGHGLNI